jgi:hypothetical protein
MMNAHLRRLFAEICTLIGVACEASGASCGTLRIADFDVLLVCDADKPQHAAAYFDLGPLPEEGRQAVMMQMLEINHGIGPSCKGMLSVEPESQRVLCVLPFVLDELTTGRAVLDELTAFAKELRDGDQETEDRAQGESLPRARVPIQMCWV